MSAEKSWTETVQGPPVSPSLKSSRSMVLVSPRAIFTPRTGTTWPKYEYWTMSFNSGAELKYTLPGCVGWQGSWPALAALLDQDRCTTNLGSSSNLVNEPSNCAHMSPVSPPPRTRAQ